MLNLTIAGNIGRDAETRRAGEGTVTSFPVAVESREGRDKSTIWFDVTIWGKRGEALQQYLRKGGKVVVSGTLGKREHEGKTYLKVKADQVTLMGGDNNSNRRDDTQSSGSGQGGYGGGAPAGGAPDLDDTIPFAPCAA